MNKKIYLDFERPIAELEKKIEEIRVHAETEKIDMPSEVAILQKRVQKLEQEIYANLTRWQIYQLARHPQRPHTQDYIDLLLTDFVELHGRPKLSEMIRRSWAAWGGSTGSPSWLWAHRRAAIQNKTLHRNFGMAHPEGYRKALRLMKLAAKFKRPILCFIDTPGAHPGLGSEERSVSEAIARNLFEISRLPTPIVVAIIGEGGSGGALGIGIGDRILMLENAWYSVINPESCSLILWRARDKKEEAAEALKITAPDLLNLRIIDRIVSEPFGGAHRNPEGAARSLKGAILEALRELRQIPPDALIAQRMDKFRRMGAWEE